MGIPLKTNQYFMEWDYVQESPTSTVRSQVLINAQRLDFWSGIIRDTKVM